MKSNEFGKIKYIARNDDGEYLIIRNGSIDKYGYCVPQSASSTCDLTYAKAHNKIKLRRGTVSANILGLGYSCGMFMIPTNKGELYMIPDRSLSDVVSKPELIKAIPGDCNSVLIDRDVIIFHDEKMAYIHYVGTDKMVVSRIPLESSTRFAITLKSGTYGLIDNEEESFGFTPIELLGKEWKMMKLSSHPNNRWIDAAMIDDTIFILRERGSTLTELSDCNNTKSEYNLVNIPGATDKSKWINIYNLNDLIVLIGEDSIYTYANKKWSKSDISINGVVASCQYQDGISVIAKTYKITELDYNNLIKETPRSYSNYYPNDIANTPIQKSPVTSNDFEHEVFPIPNENIVGTISITVNGVKYDISVPYNMLTTIDLLNSTVYITPNLD